MDNVLMLNVQETNEKLTLEVREIFNGGYAGRNRDKVQVHVNELLKLGVPVPTKVPTLYPISNNLLTTSTRIQVQHMETSGEIEYVLIWANGELWVTVGSDHTDRKLEKYGVAVSKQVYPNIISHDVWKVSDVTKHWDQLELECWVVQDGKRHLYQKGSCADLMAPAEWESHFDHLAVCQEGNVFFSGTINTVAETLIFADHYTIAMKDPVLSRTIEHSYEVIILPEPIE